MLQLSTKQKIEIMQAYIDGKIIQIRKPAFNGEWKDCARCIDDLMWDWHLCEYRIRPQEPRVIYIHKDSVMAYDNPVPNGIKFIEVLDD